MGDLTTQNYWEGREFKVGKVDNHPFKKIFDEYIKPGIGKRVLEIGCAPGAILAFIAKRFGYKPEGVDYVKNAVEETSRVLKNNGIKDFKIHQADFREWKTKEKYDIVTSFGFIEHFINPEEIVKKHLELMKKDGMLIIEVPNFNGLRKILAKTVDKENYFRHNMKVMNLDFYKDLSKKFNLKIKHLGYFGGFEYQWDNKKPRLYELIIYAPFKIIGKITKKINLNNKILSQYIFFIAENNNS